MKTKKNAKRKQNIPWIASIFVVTVVVSASISFLSSIIFDRAGIVPAFFVLLLIVALGIVFDIIGVAVTAADARPFHSMASHKAPGAVESIFLLKNSERVSSICNDVVGDICGVISGVASATLILLLIGRFSVFGGKIELYQMIMTALISGLTVGGKAFGKIIAINQSTKIVHMSGLVIYYVKSIPKLFRKKSRKTGGK